MAAELQTLYHNLPRAAPGLYLEPALMRRRVLEEQVELWWFREPRRSLLCYCASVALIVGLGLGGVGLLSTTTSLSGEWRLGVGTTLCLLALAMLLKQLLSSAIQDMNCVRSRRRIDQLKSGGRADPALILAVGLAVALCGTVLLGVAAAGSPPGHDSREMLASGLALMAAGAAMVMAVAGYGVMVCLEERRERRRRRRTMRTMRTMRTSRARRTGGGGALVFNVSGGHVGQSRREMFSSRTSLI